MKKRIKAVIIILVFTIISKPYSSAQDLSNISEIKPFAINGNFGVNLSHYSSSGIQNRYLPFDYSLVGAVNMNIYGVSVPITATISEQQNSVTQPFNQFGLSPQYKWIKLHAGWRNLNYSQFTLAGHSFLGGGIDLNPGIFRMSGMYGRLLKSSEGDSNSIFNRSALYSRLAYSFKLGIGTTTDYIDIAFLKAWDDTNSIQNQTVRSSIKPAENNVLGISGKTKILESLSFELDAAASIYTMDTRAESLSSQEGFDFLKSIDGIIKARTSTQLTSALQAGLQYRINMLNCRVTYKRIDPDYKSMGMYYSETDVENIVIAPSIALLNNSLRLGTSIGVQRDNLSNIKMNTTNRIIGSFDASYQKQNYGIDAKYSTYGITQSKGLVAVNDTIKISKVNHNLNLLGRYNFNTSGTTNVIVLNLGYQTLVDNNARSAINSESDNYIGVLGYNLGLNKLGLNLSLNLNTIFMSMANTKNNVIGPSIGINYSGDGQYSVGTSMSYQIQDNELEGTSKVINASANANYKISNNQSLRLDANYLKTSSNSAIPKFSEIRVNFGYSYSFN